MREIQAFIPFLVISGRERLKQVPVRILLMLVMAWCLPTAGYGQWIGPWLLFAVSVQLFEIWSLAPFRKGWRVRRLQVVQGVLSTTLMGSTYAGMAVLLWQSGHPVLATLSALTLSGGLLTNINSSIGSRLMYLFGGAPYLLGLVSLAGFEALISGPEMALLTMAITSLGILSIMNVYVRVYTMRRAEVMTAKDAEDRLHQAQQAMAERAAMAAIVSHELRTPLSAIVAGAQIVRYEKDLERRNETAELIIDAGRLMTGMLNDLLDHSKMEAGAMQLDRCDFDLTSFVSGTGNFWRGAIQQKGLSLDVIAPADEPMWLYGDAFRLRQIINNLMSNAIKFTAKGSIRLIAETEMTGGLCHLTLTVQDDGIGIPPEVMDRLFTPFSQASSEVARTYGGTGLGLSVSRNLAKLMGGDLVAFSAMGEGASFVLSVILPLGQAVDDAEDTEQADPEITSNMRVLAVDDHEVNRRTMALVLHPLDVDLTTASSGAEALEYLSSHRFDVVLMDVNMPGLDGNETTRRLRANPGLNQSVPVIGFSAGTEEREVQACFKAGMTDWIAKPLEPRKLYEAMQRAVQMTEDQREVA